MEAGISLGNRQTPTALTFGSLSLTVQLIELARPRLGCRPFRLHAAWLLHSDYFKWMEEWKWDGDLIKALKDFSLKLVAWN